MLAALLQPVIYAAILKTDVWSGENCLLNVPVSLLSLVKVFRWGTWRTQPTLKWLRLARWVTQHEGTPERSRRAQVQAPNLILTGSTNCQFPYFFVACQRVLQFPRTRSGESRLTVSCSKCVQDTVTQRIGFQHGGSLPKPRRRRARLAISYCCFPQHFPSAPSHQRFRDANCPSSPQRYFSKWDEPQITQHSPQGLSQPLGLSDSVDEVRWTEP